ncbi:protein TWIN LOV 1-like isoform X1 [Hibiscus syriacus]|uniref:Protein TWIN LOV 1-like isoform X1 n=1 Tax=Hibiscus syriacus TaxID=106335 RepID=A0A6A2XTQ3_HIBSY|nr:protein TWIN LOV 1-like isoform X1 [Hibiscus syriacus]
MNFLLSRSNQQATPELPPPVPEEVAEPSSVSNSVTSLEGLIAEDQFPKYPTVANHDAQAIGYLDGWITIPYKDLPDDWNCAPDIRSLRSLDRSFVFPGEQVHVLACLSACNQETEIITPFKVAAVMSKNGRRKGARKQNGNMEGVTNPVPQGGDVSPHGAVMDQNGDNLGKDKIDPAKDVSARLQSLVSLSGQKKVLLGQLLRSEMDSQQSIANETKNNAEKISTQNAVIDRGDFDASVSGGVARDAIKCFSLSNGDMVVLLKVNVGVDFLRDPVIEILQFEKYQDRNPSSENRHNLVYANQDPCRELLKWLLPLDNALPTPPILSPPPLGSASGISSTSHSVTPPPGPVKAQSSKPSFDLNELDHSSHQNNLRGKNSGIEELLSFRGLSLERERYSVHCGLEGIHIPGRRWRRKLQIIQPIEILSYATDCNTDDLLCVQIKNVSPENIPDIVIYIDAISVVLEETSKGGPPPSLPISCIEAGDDHSLPNLALRRGEEHSFILKPVSSIWKDVKTYGETYKSSGLQPPSQTSNRKWNVSIVNHYAVMVSCRCNYTESRLFSSSQQVGDHVFLGIMISVASEMPGQHSGPDEGVTELPVQVLTLQASNLSPEDLTMTVLAPTSFTSPPSVVSLNSPTTAVQKPDLMATISDNQKGNGDAGARFTSSYDQLTPIADFIPTSGLGCSHLWLQSRVPLGRVPAQSTATIKLELLPLTDGIITLDTLQIYVMEKGLAYIPEQSLMINTTSSVSTGII